MKKVILLLVITFSLPGCGIGAAIIGNQGTSIINPVPSRQGKRLDPRPAVDPWIRTDDLIKTWGSPDKIIKIRNNVEKWEYRFGSRWNGIILEIIILPLPLILPVGYDYVEFTVENNWVTNVRTKNQESLLIIGCGLYYKWGCGFNIGETDQLGDDINSPLPQRAPDRIINNTDKTVRLFLEIPKRRQGMGWTDGKSIEVSIKPNETKTVYLSGKSILIKNEDGKILIRSEIYYLSSDYSRENNGRSVDYVITENGIFPIPIKYQNDWRDHLGEIILWKKPLPQ